MPGEMFKIEDQFLRFISGDDCKTKIKDDIKLYNSPFILKLSPDNKYIMIMGINY